MVKYFVNQPIVEGDIIANSSLLCGKGLEVEKANEEEELVHHLGAEFSFALATNWSDGKFKSFCLYTAAVDKSLKFLNNLVQFQLDCVTWQLSLRWCASWERKQEWGRIDSKSVDSDPSCDRDIASAVAASHDTM